MLNMEANVEVDITAMYALEQLRTDLAGRGVVLALTRVKNDLRIPLEAFGLIDAIGEEFIFPTLPVAVHGYDLWMAEYGNQG